MSSIKKHSNFTYNLKDEKVKLKGCNEIKHFKIKKYVYPPLKGIKPQNFTRHFNWFYLLTDK